MRTTSSLLGAYHTCAILDNGDLKCWGYDAYGQLGDGFANGDWYVSTNQPSSTPVNLGSGRTAVAVSAGQWNTCAILDNGELKCWGYDFYGQLGDGGSSSSHNHNSRTYSPGSPINLGTNRTAVAVSVSHGGSHTCAILDNGDLKCWGRDYSGQLGDGGPAWTSTNPTSLYAPSSTAIDLGCMTNVTGATCTVSPALPTGLNIDTSTCTISGTPSVVTSNTTYTVTANISGTTYQGTVWLATVPFGTITSPVMGAELDLGEAMTPITLNYTSQAGEATVYNGNGTAWMVKDIYSGSDSGNPGVLNGFGNSAIFTADDGTHGKELWKSDGTAAGTVMIKDINLGSGDGVLSGVLPVDTDGDGEDDTVYFVANDGTHGYELWKTDGTTSGTVMVKDIRSGSSASSLSLHTAVGNTLYFQADDGIHGMELWKSDGTAAGTVMVKDIYSGSDSGISYPDITAIGNTIYFSANDGTHGIELWKTDGTATGTVMVKDIRTPGYSWVDYITAVGNTLFFTADVGSGHELWTSDGTASGTYKVKEINPSGHAVGGNVVDERWNPQAQIWSLAYRRWQHRIFL